MKSVGIVETLGLIPESQHGYFTWSQATQAGLNQSTLRNAAQRGSIQKVGVGVYLIAGATPHPFPDLWVAWLRIANDPNLRARTLKPAVWVSHQSAASVHGFGDFIADTHHFITKNRRGQRAGVKLHHYSAGLERNEWQTKDGFALTTIERTVADLLHKKIDGGHIGRFVEEALDVNATTIDAIMDATKRTRREIEALLTP